MGKAFGSPRMASVLAVVLGLLALGASLADVPLAIARHQTGPGGPVGYTLVTLAVAFKTPVAVAAATLAAAALFNPLRRRVQHAVDRRFNRAHYDAETVVAAFTARLRHSADFDTVHGDLVSTVHQAFQPAHISLWSAPGPALRRRASAREGG